MNAVTLIAPIAVGKVDFRLAFLARAAARFELVEAGEMDIAEAFDGLVASLRCGCSHRRVGIGGIDAPR